MLSRPILSRCLSVILVSLLAIGAASAQDSASPSRDPQALAARYLGFTGDAPTPPLTPIYKVGDTAQFWVGKTTSDTPVRVNATLAAAADNVYLWVEDGVDGGAGLAAPALAATAQQLSQIVALFRQRDNYRQPVTLPGGTALTDPTDLLPVPDVDNDPHLYILYTTQLSSDQNAILNPLDSLPVQYAPYSNQHEMLTMNTSTYPGVPLSDPLYISILIRGIYRWIINTNVPGQADWLTEMLDWALLLNVEKQPISVANLSAYLQTADTPLIERDTATNQAQTLGGRQLFLAYLFQRFGGPIINDLFLQSGSGIAALDAVLARRNVIDPASGAPVTARDAFADFVMTNGINLPFGDGRYVESSIQLPQGLVASPTPLDPAKDMNGLSVNQFGAQYFDETASQAATVKLKFAGSPTVARLPMPTDRDPADKFYWSGHAVDQNPTLTRAVDLSGVSQATLTFDAWYNLDPGWNYGYVSASTDGGATWKALGATNSSADNHAGADYGASFTGISNSAKPRPFPVMGVIIGGDGITIGDLAAGGPAAKAGVQRGDIIIGYDNHTWAGTPDVLGLLANYSAGDTLHLYIQRGSQRLDIPVVLGAHPTRTIDPPALWLAQTVDLTPYAGKQLLLRFETVMLPGHEDQGFAVDNLAIPEIHWSDNASGDLSGWTANGWQQVDNQEPQQWIVQMATSGTQSKYPRVQRLIDAGDTTSSGEWQIALDAGETLTVVVSGVNDDTTQRANFTLGLTK